MSFAAILLQAAVSAPAPQADSEILVVAPEKLIVRGHITARQHDGVLTIDRCSVTLGSSDPEINAIPCDLARQCMVGTAPPATRKALGQCVNSQLNSRVAAMLTERRAASEAQP